MTAMSEAGELTAPSVMCELGEMSVLPLFVLRGAGFPAAEALLPGAGDTHADVARMRDTERRLERLERALLTVLATEPIERPERRRLRRRLASRAPVDEPGKAGPTATALIARWNTLVAELAELRACTVRAGETELAGADRYLRDWHRTPVAAEAVWFSSRGAAGALAAYALGRPGSATTRRVALRYLQRLATKNETTSFFGPFQYGAVTDGAGTALLAFDAASPRHGERDTFLARHVIDDLARRIGEDLAAQPRVLLEPHPLVHVHHRGLRAAGRNIALPEPLVAALRSGRVRPADLPEPLRAPVARLTRAGLLSVRLAPPSTSLAELADLRAAVDATAEAAPEAAPQWLARIDTVTAAVDRVRRSPWPARKEACADVDALLEGYGITPRQRENGSLYADRHAVYEECEGGLRGLRLDRRALARVERPLETVLRVHAAYAAQVRGDAQDWMRRHWDAAALPARVRLYELLEALHHYPQPDYRDGSAAADALWQRLDAVAPEGHSRVDVGADRLAGLFADVLPDDPFVCSPDLMVRRTTDGTERIVVGEIHHGIQPWSWLARALPAEQRTALRDVIGVWARELAGAATPVTVVEPRLTGKTYTLEYPGLALERMGRSSLPRDQVLGLHDVVADRDGMTLHTTDGTRLALMPTGPVSPLARAFGGLALWGPRGAPLRHHRPRVSVDGMVWLREVWRVGPGELAALSTARTPTAALVAAHRLRERLALPRFVYVKADGEPKPVFVDLESVAYCDMVAHLVAGRAGAVVSEMLPDPDELALHCSQGAFTSEIRMSVLVRRPR